jgi:hypothetical protein
VSPAVAALRCAVLWRLICVLQAPGAVNNWNAAGMPAPDDWEIDISQLHIDSKVGVCPACT